MNTTKCGTYAGVYAHERAGTPICDGCLDARRRYGRRRSKLRLMGVPARIPLGANRYARLVAARERGATYQAIADAIGVSVSTPYHWLRNGPQVLTTPTIAAKIDTATLPQPVTHIGVLRRLQALAWLGYSCGELARRADGAINEQTLFEALASDRTLFHDRVRDAIVALYDALWDEPVYDVPAENAQYTGGRTRARNRALRNGWFPPMAWDDIDDPAEQPSLGREGNRHKHEVDEAAVLRAMAGDRSLDLTRAERFEVVNRLRNRGWSLLDIEARTVITKPERYLTPADEQDGEAA